MNGRPFLFDENLFDEEGNIIRSDIPVDETLIPRHTDITLQETKKNAYEKGLAEGRAQAIQSQEQEILKLLQKIEKTFPLLVADETARNEKYEAEAIHLCYSILRKTLPHLMAKHNFDELKLKITHALDNIEKKSVIKIAIHESSLEALKKYLTDSGITEHKNITFASSTTIPVGDCHISWDDGGANLSRTKMVQTIQDILQETLADHNIHIQDEVCDNEGINLETSESEDRQQNGEHNA